MKKLFCAALAALLLNCCAVSALAASASPYAGNRPAASIESGRRLMLKLPKAAKAPESEPTQESKPAAEDDWMLRLVNRENPLEETFAPAYEEIEHGFVLDQRAAPFLRQMLADAKDAGVSLVINSAYRPYSSQQRIYRAKLEEYYALGCDAENAKKMTELYVAVPGCSEHQLGLAADIVTAGCQKLNSSYAATDAAKWLAANAPRYGFILRYPENKVEITNTAFEPWHFRYVGEDAARKITEQGLCLEEYCAAMAAQEESRAIRSDFPQG